ncbi:MAG TPA: two-component regulator propeller domain-containing protein, partial [Thermoanaerobaculia bacterium]|nr:two-component regulator propeller domain-containing protein [Thermoanaerobaculia bacterium]
MRPFIALLLVLACVCVPASAQVLRAERLTQDDGLSQNFINAVAQDSFGFLWIGTQDGLNRFDGYEVRSFRPDGSRTSLQDGHVRDVRAGRDGVVWIATREGGLSRWDPASETFKTWMHDEHRANSLSADYITSIQPDADGTLWLGTFEGLDHFDPKTETFRHFRNELATHEVGMLFRDANGTLWIGLRDGSLDSMDAQMHVAHHGAMNIAAIANADRGRVWFGTEAGQLLLWDPSTRTFAPVPGVPSDHAIKSLLVDRRGALWIATDGGGLLHRDRSGALRVIKTDPSDPHTIPSDEVQTLFEDRTGVLWIGTPVGLARHDPASAAFRVYRTATPYVWAIESDRDGNLWLGADGALSFFNRATGEWQTWTGNPADPKTLASESVVALLVDRNGDVWAGGNRGLSRYSPSTKTFESWQRGDATSAFPHGRVFDLLETRDGSILAGTSHGAVQWDPTAKTFHLLGGDGLIPTVFTMAEDRDGAIWLGTFHNGLYRLDRRTNSVSRLTIDEKGTQFAPQQISSSLVDSRGRLWIGTSQGVFRRDPGARVVRQYRIRDGLPNEGIMGIVEDAHGRIWLSTNEGIARLDPANDAIRVYKARDGLPSNEFNQMAAGRSARGEILFGTPAGAVIFNPDELRADTQAPQVAITGFEVFNAPVPIRRGNEKGFTLAQSILTTHALTLSYREKVVTFAFAGLHFADPRATRYAYRLFGWDDNWREAP